jgi:hypothetical protein
MERILIIEKDIDTILREAEIGIFLNATVAEAEKLSSYDAFCTGMGYAFELLSRYVRKPENADCK